MFKVRDWVRFRFGRKIYQVFSYSPYSGYTIIGLTSRSSGDFFHFKFGVNPSKLVLVEVPYV